jgi:hypothetical protein
MIGILGLIPLMRLRMLLPAFIWTILASARTSTARSGSGEFVDSTFRLPGLLAQSMLTERRKSYNRPFAVLAPQLGNQRSIILPGLMAHSNRRSGALDGVTGNGQFSWGVIGAVVTA